MPIIPKLNLKAAIRFNDSSSLNISSEPNPIEATLSKLEHASESQQLTEQAEPVTSPIHDEENEYEFDDGDFDDDHNFKTTLPLTNEIVYTNSIHEDGGETAVVQPSSSSSLRVELGEESFTKIKPLTMTIDNGIETSLQSFSDGDSVSGLSIRSDVSYTCEALQIMSKVDQINQQRLKLKQPKSPTPSDVSTYSATKRKRRRTIQKLTEDPNKLPLCDLLFYNPPLTIFQSKAQEDINNNSKDDESSTKAPASIKCRRSSRTRSVASDSSNKSDRGKRSLLNVDNLDEIDEETVIDENLANASNTDNEPLKFDESGNIVINETNLFNDPKAKKPEAKMKSSTTYTSFRRRERTSNAWNSEETSMFYTALELVGTDFTLMEAVFFKNSVRDRRQLKQKFKREEKVNREYIDSILFKTLQKRSKMTKQLQTVDKDLVTGTEVINVAAVAATDSGAITTPSVVIQSESNVAAAAAAVTFTFKFGSGREWKF
ncbi:Transcription factor TFIIIB component B [Blomia tropicalis]|nr:Transcription factor TFIIIB component B [Blomia tropicalis]